LQVNGTLTHIPELFLLYHNIPLLNIVREPNRFDLIVSIATSILAASGTAELLKRIDKNKDSSVAYQHNAYSSRLFIVGIIVLLMLIESNAFQTSALLVNSTSTHISVPRLYYELRNVSGNFSIMQLPALPVQTSPEPELYIGMESYYASVAGRPAIGGYVTRSNNTMQLSVYNIPLAVQSTLLAEGTNMSYPSPVSQSLANETLMTLFNYDAGFVIILRSAYNTSQLSSLVGYATAIFGSPVYVGNSTIAFQTANAISANLFKSYVAYPYLPSWTPESVALNGSMHLAWVPITPPNSEEGTISVYSPYATNSSLSKALSGYVGTINTTISFRAFTNSGFAKAYIAEQSGLGYKELAAFNITSAPSYYSFVTPLVSGAQGSTLLFDVPQNFTSSGHIVYFSNITFSKS
ncbi:MAG: hypothetical protein QXW10_04595, partial [Candidatus Micrarchaeaceae archaeon]